MKKALLFIFVVAFIAGCVTSRIDLYRAIIRSDFLQSEHHRAKNSATVKVTEVIQDKSLDQLIEQSGLEIDPADFYGYEMVNYVVSYDGTYFLENYQVFRKCDKKMCHHKFLLIIGIYA